jgi:hypothetical protein
LFAGAVDELQVSVADRSQGEARRIWQEGDGWQGKSLE